MDFLTIMGITFIVLAVGSIIVGIAKQNGAGCNKADCCKKKDVR